MPLVNKRLYGEVHTAQQSAVANKSSGPVGMTRRGKVHTADHGRGVGSLANEGAYYVATNPTAGTGIPGIILATEVNPLEHLVALMNNNSAADGRRIRVDFLTLLVTAAGTNGTDIAWVTHVDVIDRYTSGGSVITPACTNANEVTATGALLQFGAVVSPAASAARLIGGGLLRVGITVVGDIYNFTFGGRGMCTANDIVNSTPTVAMNIPVAPVVLGPGDSWLFQINATAQDGASSFEFQLGYWEY